MTPRREQEPADSLQFQSVVEWVMNDPRCPREWSKL